MSEEFDVPASGDDIYRYFVLPMEMARDRVVVAMEFRPGNPEVVHHSNFFVDYTGRGRKMDRDDPEPGFSVFGTGGFMSYDGDGALGAWAPGVGAYRLPEGRGFDLPRGGDLVLEIHYHLTGKAGSDRSSFAFYFADQPVKRGVTGLFIGTQEVDIPAGDRDYWRRVSMELPADMQLVDIGPHMHYLGRESIVTATLPDGEELPLLHVDDWDLRWQGTYTYSEPVELPAGTTVEGLFRFDNSTGNSSNPSSPPRRVKWGWGSDEEMAELYLTVISADRKAEAALHRAAAQSWMRSSDPEAPKVADLAPAGWLERLLETDLWSAEGEEMLTQLASTESFEAVVDLALTEGERGSRRVAASTTAGVLLSIAAMYGGSEAEVWRLANQADEAFGRALRADRRNGSALLGRATLYAESGDPQLIQQGVRLLRRLVDEDATDTTAAQLAYGYRTLGESLEDLGRQEEASAVWDEGHRRVPDDPELRERAAATTWRSGARGAVR